ncbi:MAG: SDR family NAD(P)-dependent oxidoreductase [Pseudomonadota bacterium]
MNPFQNKVAVVTGAGSGIGRALALALARRGARLALSDIGEAGLNETGALAVALGATVHLQRLDVSDRQAFEAYAAAVVAHHGVVHQVYNNAGVALNRGILDSSYAEYEKVLAVNLWGVIHGTKAFLPHLIASGDGHVINVSSLNGLLAYPGLSHYCASKFAVRGFTEVLAIEMLQGGHPVAASGVYPGGIKTNITANSQVLSKSLGVPVDAERASKYDAKLLRFSADTAAEIVLDGVAKKRLRILVGSDARMVDKLVRALPSMVPRLVVAFSQRVHGGSAFSKISP